MRISLVLLFLTCPAFADETADHAPKDVPQEAMQVEPRHHSRFSFAMGPAWMHSLADNYSPAFTANGFSAPGRDRVALDLLGYWTTETRWQLGIGLDTVSFEKNNGTYAADFSNDVLGLFVGRNLSASDDTDFSVGGILGVNSAELNVFSAARNGRLRESAAVVAPSVGYASRVSRAVKIGLRAAYWLPFGESTQITGQDLAVGRIGIRGFSLALHVIFGR
jgi:hypothetical protein